MLCGAAGAAGAADRALDCSFRLAFSPSFLTLPPAPPFRMIYRRALTPGNNTLGCYWSDGFFALGKNRACCRCLVRVSCSNFKYESDRILCSPRFNAFECTTFLDNSLASDDEFKKWTRFILKKSQAGRAARTWNGLARRVQYQKLQALTCWFVNDLSFIQLGSKLMSDLYAIRHRIVAFEVKQNVSFSALTSVGTTMNGLRRMNQIWF